MAFTFNPLFPILDITGGSSSAPTIGGPVIGADANSVLLVDSAGLLADSGSLTDGQIVIGDTGNTPVAGNIAGTSNEIVVTNGPGSIVLSLDTNISATKIANGTVDNTEFQSLNGVTSNIQTQLDDKASIDLDNLSATTAVNQVIRPAVSNSITLGSAGNIWSTTFTSEVATNSIGTVAGNGSVTVTNPFSMSTNKISALGDPTAAQDAATKNYVDTQDALYIPLTQKAANNGVASLDGAGKVPVSQLPSAVMTYEGVWNATTNTPTLADGAGDSGQVYRVSVAGTQNLGSGAITFDVGDYVIYNGTVWEKSDTTDAVASVNGQIGVVVLTTTNISEGTSLYFTDERAQDAVGSLLTDSATIDFTYDDAAPSISASVIDGSITNVKVATGIDAVKIGAGTVDNTEFGYLNGVTSAIQTQLGNKADLDLGNITQITSNLVPNATHDLGEPGGNEWRRLYVQQVLADGGQASIAFGTSGTVGLYDSTPVISIDWENRQLRSGATSKLDWSGTNLDINTRKITNVVDPTSAQDAATKAYVDSLTALPSGDIPPTSFVPNNNQTTLDDVTGLLFPSASVRGFTALVSVSVTADNNSDEIYTLAGIQISDGSWVMTVTSTGQETGFNFDITNAGQVQYTSLDAAGYVGSNMRFRAQALPL